MATNSQIEANRRNAQKSTGPRTEEGKSRSRFNAVTHGMTAKFDAVPGEDADTLRRRIDDWTADLNPRNQVERDLIERAARASWQLDRVEQAHVDRLTANILKATSGENEAVENEVFALGARLFPELGGRMPPGRVSWMIRINPRDLFCDWSRRPRGVAGCWTVGPSCDRCWCGNRSGNRPTSSRQSDSWASIPSMHSMIAR